MKDAASEGCFLIDGDEKGFNEIADEFDGNKNPPVISIGNKKLIVIGDPNNNFTGGMESLLMRFIDINQRQHEAIENLLQITNLNNAQKDKVRLVLITFLKTNDYEVFFSVDRFASSVLKLVGNDNIRQVFHSLRII